jgi:indole-3-glycerol phosphate synthase
VKLLAEVKKASPSRGVLAASFDPVGLATTYARHGAAAISVLTDEKYFQGSLDLREAVRAAVPVPLLRKDFTLDEYQLWESRARGATRAVYRAASTWRPARPGCGPGLVSRPVEVHAAAELEVAWAVRR